jgi:hypothetical protein
MLAVELCSISQVEHYNTGRDLGHASGVGGDLKINTGSSRATVESSHRNSRAERNKRLYWKWLPSGTRLADQQERATDLRDKKYEGHRIPVPFIACANNRLRGYGSGTQLAR